MRIPTMLVLSTVVATMSLAGCAKSNPVASSTPTSKAAYTIQTATVPGVGTILVDGDGRALYLLTSAQGTAVPCTDASGCTKVWPHTQLPAGVSQPVAGSGISASLLTTTKEASGHLHITYGGWPLSRFSGDSGPGTAQGQGIKSFGGTWWVIGVDGKPVTTMASTSGATPRY